MGGYYPPNMMGGPPQQQDGPDPDYGYEVPTSIQAARALRSGIGSVARGIGGAAVAADDWYKANVTGPVASFGSELLGIHPGGGGGGAAASASAAAPNPNQPQSQAATEAAHTRAESEAQARRDEAVAEAQDASVSSVLNQRDQQQATATAETNRTTNRAYRMPGGRVVFTNQPGAYAGAGGAEISEPAAATSFRGASPQAPVGPVSLQPERGDFSPKMYGGASDAQDQARRLVMNSELRRAQPGVAGMTPLERPGVSTIEGTPEQQQDRELESSNKVIALARRGSAFADARLSPRERAELSTPSTVMLDYLARSPQYMPKIQRAAADADAAIQAISTPGDPHYVADPKQRDNRVRQIQGSRDATIAAINASMAAGAGTTYRQY